MSRRRSWSMYSPHFERPKPPDDGGWRTTFLLVFAIIGLMGAGSVLMIARTVHAMDGEVAQVPQSSVPALHVWSPGETTSYRG